MLPEHLRGQTLPLAFELTPGDSSLDSAVRIDNVRFASPYLAAGQTGDVIDVHLQLAGSTASGFQWIGFESSVTMQTEQSGVYALRSGTTTIGRVFLAETVHQTDFLTSGVCYFVPETTGAIPDEDVLTPGYQGTLRGRFRVGGREDVVTIQVEPGFATRGPHVVRGDGSAVNGLRVEQRLRYLGFPNQGGTLLQADHAQRREATGPDAGRRGRWRGHDGRSGGAGDDCRAGRVRVWHAFRRQLCPARLDRGGARGVG